VGRRIRSRLWKAEFPLDGAEGAWHIYVYPASETVMRINTLDIVSGERKPFRTITPADPIGMRPSAE
jgi:hypothetical protein